MRRWILPLGSRGRSSTKSIVRGHDPGVGDRPDPRAPPDPRRARGTPRAAEPPIDAGLREPGPVTRPTPVRRHHDLRVRTAPPTPRSPAGPVGVRGRPTAASPWAPPALAPPADRRSNDAHGARARGRARRGPSRGAGKVGDGTVRPTNSRPTPIEIPIPGSTGCWRIAMAPFRPSLPRPAALRKL